MRSIEQLYKSNFFRLQTTELLTEVTPPFGSANLIIEKTLKELRRILCALPAVHLSWERSSEPLNPPKASHPHHIPLQLFNQCVCLPFLPPTKVKLVGSYLLRTTVRPHLNIDLTVEIPAKCFHEKDYLDHRYTDKRLLYLSHLAVCLSGELSLVKAGDVRFTTLPHAQESFWPIIQFPLRCVSAARGDEPDLWQVSHRMPTHIFHNLRHNLRIAFSDIYCVTSTV